MANTVVRLCSGSDDYASLGVLVGWLRDELFAGARTTLWPWMGIEGLTATKANALYTAGIRTPSDVRNAAKDKMVKALSKALRSRVGGRTATSGAAVASRWADELCAGAAELQRMELKRKREDAHQLELELQASEAAQENFTYRLHGVRTPELSHEGRLNQQ